MRNVARGLVVIAAIMAFWGFANPAAEAAPLTLTGNYLQVGISDYGTFGSDGATEPGLLHDPTGNRNFSPGGIYNDYLTPGNPHDGFAIDSTETGFVANDNNGLNTIGYAAPMLLTGAGAQGYTNAAVWSATYNSSFTISNAYFFNPNDEQILVVTRITAIADLHNVAFARSEDPDPDLNRYGSFVTTNTQGDAKTSSKDLVSAAGPNTGLTIGILNLSGDTYPHSTAISTDCCSTQDPYTILASTPTAVYPTTNSGDYGLQMAWNFGDLSAGQSVLVSYKYVFGTNQGLVSVPARTINTTDGDIAPNIFSLGSPAATTSPVEFDGGILRMQGGAFPNNVVLAPVTITALNGTVDTSTGNGGFSGVVSGPGSLTIEGGGPFMLSGANLYTGGTILSGSTVAVGSSSALGTGALTMNGGTLQAAADGLAIANGITLAQTATVDTQGFGLSLTGAVGGPGGLAKVGTGILALSGADSYAGPTTVVGGVLRAGSATGLSAASAFSVASGATLDLGGFSTALVSIAGAGTITNSGPAARLTVGGGNDSMTFGGALTDGGAPLSLTKTGSGTLALTGASSYSGGTALKGGTLAVGNGGALGSGALAMASGTTLDFLGSLTLPNAIVFTGTSDPTIDTGANMVTLSGPISGPDALTKVGSGVLDLTGTDTYTGATTVAAGTLLVDGSIAASTVTVQSGASIGGMGRIGGLIVEGGAVLAPGAGTPFSTLAVGGNVTMQGGSLYRVEIDPAGRTDSVAATGTATLNGGTVDLRAVAGSFNPAQSYTILSASAGVSGRFAALTTSSDFAFLTPQLVYGADDVEVRFSQSVPLIALAATPNQRAVATAIQGLGPDNALFKAVVAQDAAGARQAFTATAGEAHADATAQSVTSTRLVANLIFDRLWNIAGGTDGDAVSVLDKFNTTTLPTLLRCYSPAGEGAGDMLSTYTVWGQGIGAFGTTQSDGNGGRIGSTLGGFALGGDRRLDAPGFENWRVGVAGGYTSTSFDVKSAGSRGTFQNVFGTLYGGARYGVVDIRLGATYGGTSSNLRRTVALPGFLDNVRSSSGGYTVEGFGEVGYRLAFGQSVVEPVLGATITHVHQDGFREKGGAAALIGFAQDNDVGSTVVGVRGEATPIASIPLGARVFLGWQHAYGDVNPAQSLAFASGSTRFEAYGTPLDRNSLVAETGLDWRATSQLAMGVAYTGSVGHRASDNAVKGRVEYRF